MKILIVDDEIFVRMGIKTTYDWAKNGFEIIGEAEDGIEATELFLKHRPDIVLVDIKMPRMNGIDFIAKVKDMNPYCRFIVLSCHNEFEYVREAMKLGVRDYIMKTTIKKDEFMEVIARVAREIQAEKDKLNVLNAEKHENYVNKPIVIKKFFNDVIDKIEMDESRISRRIVDFQLDIAVPNLFIVLISFDNFKKLKQECDPKNYDLFAFGVINISQEIIEQYTNGYVFKRRDNDLVGFINFSEDVNEAQKKIVLSSIAADIMKSVKEFLGMDISVGISSSLSRLSQISEGYNNAMTALERRFFTGSNSVNFFKEAVDNDLLLMERLRVLEDRVIHSISSLDFEEAAREHNSLCGDEILKTGTNPRRVQNVFLNIIFTLVKVLHLEGINENELIEQDLSLMEQVFGIEHFYELMDYVESLLNKAAILLKEKYGNKYANINAKLKDYFMQNEKTDITLNDAAAYVNLSPGYLSKLFKDLTGQNFIDYVLNIKIEKAKNMIKEGEKFWIIAQSLGYTEVSSFSRVFKRVVGISPKQYKMKYFK